MLDSPDDQPVLTQLTLLLDHLPDRVPMGMALFDREFRLLRCNPTWVGFIERYTHSRAEAVVPGVSLFELAPGSEEGLGPLVGRLLAGETVRLDGFQAESQGIVSFWDVLFVPIIQEGEVIAILDATTDATERVRAYRQLQATAEALAERERRFQLVMHATHDGMWDWDVQSDQVYFSPRWKSMLGYGEDEIADRFDEWASRLHPDDREMALNTVRAYLEGELPTFDFEHRLRHKDGSYRWIRTRGTLVRDASGEPVRLVGSHSDVTERRLIEQELRQSEANLLSLLETATSFVIYRVAVDPDAPYSGRVTLVSPSITDLLGIEDPYRFDSWFANLHPDDLDRVVKANRRSWEEGVPYDQPARFYHAQREEWVWVHTMSRPVHDGQGKLTHFNGLIVDITEQKRAEEALQRQVALEDTIATISARFINLPLADIDQGINDALQAIGQFAGVDRSYVFLYSSDAKTMHSSHEWCAPGIEPQISRMQDVSVESLGWSNSILFRGEVVDIPLVGELPPEAEAERVEFQLQGIRSLVAVPMVYQGETVGLIGFDAVRSPREWSDQDILLLRMVGEIVVNALEHRRAQAIQAGQRQFLELLAVGGSLPDTLHALVRIIEEQWPGMLGLVLLLDPDGRHLHIGASVSLPEEYVDTIEGLEIGPMVGSCGTACFTGQRVIVEDIMADPRWDDLRDLAVKYGLGACWSEPVLDANGTVIATFAMYYRHRRSPSEAELRTIETGAHLVGIAVEHQRAQEALRESQRTLEQRVRERTQQLSTLLEVSRKVASTLELESLLGLILDELMTVIDCTGASVLTLDGDQLQVRAYRGPIPAGQAAAIRLPLEAAPIYREVIRRREPVIIPDVRQDSDLARLFQQTAGDQLLTTYGYIRSWIGVPLQVKDRIVGLLALDHSEPSFYLQHHAELASTFANQVAVAIENARLYLEEQDRRVEAQRRRQVAEGLREVLAVLNSDRPAQEVLDFIARQACQLMSASGSIIHHVEHDRGQVTIEASHGLPIPRREPKVATKIFDGYADRAIFCRKPYAIPDLRAYLAVLDTPEGEALDQGEREWRRAMLKAPGYGAFLALPLVVGDQVYGSIALYFDRPTQFSEEDLGLGLSLGNQAALAIENARLRAQVEEAAASAERSRLARDLHDAVTQTLFSASLIAEVLPRIWERQPEEGKRRLGELRELTRGALAEMRTLLLELRPTTLVEAELADLLRQLAESITGRARVPISVHVEGTCHPATDLKVALYRIAQEALNNVAKHAAASQARVSLACHPGRVELVIADDGRGFDPAQVSPESLGLGIMRERAEALDIQLTIDSQVDRGTRIAAAWSEPNAGE